MLFKLQLHKTAKKKFILVLQTNNKSCLKKDLKKRDIQKWIDLKYILEINVDF